MKMEFIVNFVHYDVNGPNNVKFAQGKNENFVYQTNTPLKYLLENRRWIWFPLIKNKNHWSENAIY